jgi:hypothetical protein
MTKKGRKKKGFRHTSENCLLVPSFRPRIILQMLLGQFSIGFQEEEEEEEEEEELEFSQQNFLSYYYRLIVGQRL